MKKVLALLCVLSMAVMCCACGQSESSDISVNTTGISKSEYNQLSIGMSYIEVGNIIGGAGEKIGTEKSDDGLIYTYKFSGERTGYAELEFETDALGQMKLISLKENDLS